MKTIVMGVFFTATGLTFIRDNGVLNYYNSGRMRMSCRQALYNKLDNDPLFLKDCRIAGVALSPVILFQRKLVK